MSKKKKPFSIVVDNQIEKYNEKNPTKRQLSRGLIAKERGIGTQLLSDWSRGIVPDVVVHLKEIAKTLECSVDDLIKETE